MSKFSDYEVVEESLEVDLDQLGTVHTMNEGRYLDEPADCIQRSKDGKINKKLEEDAQAFFYRWIHSKATLVGFYPTSKEQQAAANATREMLPKYLSDAKFLKKGKATLTYEGVDVPVTGPEWAQAQLKAFPSKNVEIILNGGNRTLFMISLVNAARAKVGLDPITKVRVEIRRYETDADRVKDNLHLNNDRLNGVQELSFKDNFHGVLALHEREPITKEADLVSVFPHPTRDRWKRQLYYNLLRQDQIHPGAGIKDRVLKDGWAFTSTHLNATSENNGGIPGLRELIMPFTHVEKVDPDGKKKMVLRKNDDLTSIQERVKTLPEATKAVFDYFAGVKDDDGNIKQPKAAAPTKAMARKDLREIAGPFTGARKEVLLAAGDADKARLKDALSNLQDTVYHLDKDGKEDGANPITQESSNAMDEQLRTMTKAFKKAESERDAAVAELEAYKALKLNSTQQKQLAKLVG